MRVISESWARNEIAALLRYRKLAERTWTEVPMEALVNDSWRASFTEAGSTPEPATSE